MNDSQPISAPVTCLNGIRCSSLPPELKLSECRKVMPCLGVGPNCKETRPRINRVKPVVQACQPADRVRRNQKKAHECHKLGKSEPSLGNVDGDTKSELSYLSSVPGYRIHNKAFPVSGGVFSADYRIDLEEFKEASDSSDDDSDVDYESDSYVDEHRPRRSHHHWEGRYDFIFAMLAYNCNFNILWRFPYMALLCGGGSFLLAVILLTCLLGLPLLLLESSIGQLTRSGPVRAMERICTFLQGLGIAMSVVSFITSVYSNVFLAWALKLLVASANAPLRWRGCSQIWNDNTTCVEPGRDLTELSEVQSGELRSIVGAKNMENYFEDSPIEQYFHMRVLSRDYQNLSSFFTFRGEIAACLLVLWLWIYFSTWKRRKTSQLSRQFTILILYSFMATVLVKSCLEPGGLTGIKHFFIPRFEDLKNPSVWCFALGYVFNLYGLGFGVPMELAASNMFNYKNLCSDILVIIGTSLLFSILAGATVMAGAGNIAASKNIEINDLGYNIETVFIIYIHMLSGMPFPQLFLIAFFTIFLTVGLSTQFFQLDLVISAIQDNFWAHLNKYLKSREILSIFICCLGFCLSLMFCTPAGQFLLYLTDIHVAIYSPVGIVAIETVFVFWVYGWRNILRNITEMTRISFSPPIILFWILLLSFSILLLLLCQLVTSWSVLPNIFPVAALICGGFLTSIPAIIFLAVSFKIGRRLEGKTIQTKLRIGFQNNLDECSCHRLIRNCPARSSSSLLCPERDLAKQILWQRLGRCPR